MTLEIEDITDSLANRRSDLRFRAHVDYDDHEKVIYAEDKDIGFRAFIAVHNTARGPALGGCRYWSRYGSDEEAISDVLRLSRGMTYKNSVAGLALGGGKSVIIGKPGTRQPSAEVMQALGMAVNSLGGLYVSAEDVGTSVQHILIARGRTPYVAGVPLTALCEEIMPQGIESQAVPNPDPSPYTAYGTYRAIKAAARHRLGVENLAGLTVTVKGYGHVAQVLCRYLADEGAKLLISDITPQACRQIVADFGPETLLAEGREIMSVKSDIYVPCALGGDINDGTIPHLVLAGVKVVAGCANNQLKAPQHADELRRSNILYAPDYVANAGGVIAAGLQYLWMVKPQMTEFPTHQIIMDRVAKIGLTLEQIFVRAEAAGLNTAVVADQQGREGFVQRLAKAA
ncbi:MAG: Glu/Leu/Phe/Val dehydrogenase [Alphaproteobacteria bacterium]|nr:Glu/Leu/Phe/Val dehydrogenase [Alphaproteobacteria bacterium]